jgi:ferredoxin
MATMITSECINCGACEPECPNTAIYQGAVDWQAPDGSMHPAISSEIFYIVPEKCTECVGFHDHEACAAVCPVDCCVPNPDIPETHDVLLARARALHPGEAIPDDAPSRFKKEGTGASSPGADAPGAPSPAAAQAAGEEAPVRRTVPVAPPPAAAAPAAKPAPPARPAAGTGKVEKATAPPPAPRPPKTFPHELPGDFEHIVTALGAPRRRRASRWALLPLGLLAAGQGILGALPAAAKRRLEEAIGDARFFSAQLATAANVFLNLLLYPLVCAGLAVTAGRAGLFTLDANKWVMLGVTLAFAEAAWRLRESFFRGRPLADMPLRGAFYGPLLLPLGALVTALAGRRGARSGVGFDGFHGGTEHFDDKLERARRYGEVFRLEDRDDAYLFQLEFPRQVPPSSLGATLGLPAYMPDYDYHLALENGTFVVHARVVDPQVRRITGAAPAFPSEFTTRVPLAEPVTGFRHRYRDKTLDVVLPKVGGGA